MPCVEEADSFSIQRGECLFLHKAENVPLLYVEEADSFSVQGRDVSPTHRRECPSAICRGGILPIQRIECLRYTEERMSLLLLYTEERVSSLHGEESVLLLFVDVVGS